MLRQSLTEQQIERYAQEGYLIVRDFLEASEVEKLYNIAIDDKIMRSHSIDLNDSQGKRTLLSLWYKPGNDVYGLLTRSKSLVGVVGQLLDGDTAVCHFHSKLMQKEPKVGGAWEWHQDYGYWYKNEFLLPDQMMSVMVAVTEANQANGCLQVIKGSHKMGRVEHGFSGEQVGASQRFVDLALQTMDLVFVELQPGDVLFFHSNLLHRSEANLSDKARWSLISCYNRASNVGYNESVSSSSSITPIDVVPTTALLEWKTAGLVEDGAGFLSKDDDLALK